MYGTTIFDVNTIENNLFSPKILPVPWTKARYVHVHSTSFGNNQHPRMPLIRQAVQVP